MEDEISIEDIYNCNHNKSTKLSLGSQHLYEQMKDYMEKTKTCNNENLRLLE